MEENKKEINKKIVYAIMGPTCIGKTSLAIRLCKKIDGEIISFDSRQIYKEMDIGTGKIPSTAIESKKTKEFYLINDIKIYGYDLIKPNEYFSAYDYTLFAHKKIKQIQKSNKKVILVGGTGFYLDAVTARIQLDGQKPNFKLREKLQKMTLTTLQNLLEELDPGIFTKIDIKNPVRVIRAIEKAQSAKRRKEVRNTNELSYKLVGLTAARDVLYSRADRWIDSIWSCDFESEVRRLFLKYGEIPKLNGLIYKSMHQYIGGNLSFDQSKENAKFDMHAYIRRQQTYFKKMPGITWFDVSQDNFEKKLYNVFE